MLRAGRSLRVADMSKDPRRVGFPPNHPPMTSLLGVPIFVRGKLVGDLYLTDKYGGPEFREEDEWIVQLLATHAATALTNAELHSQNIRWLTNLRVVGEAAKRIATYLDPEGLAEELHRYAHELTGCDLSWVGLFDRQKRHVIPLYIRGSPDLQEYARSIKIDLQDPQSNEGPTARALASAAPQVVPDIDSDPGFAPWRDLAAKYGLRSFVSVPLAYGNEVLGVFNLYSQNDNAFGELDVALLVLMSGHATIALENAMNYQRVSRERARTQALLKVTQAISRSVQLQEVIELIVEAAVGLLNASGAAVLLLAQQVAEEEQESETDTEVGGTFVAQYARGLDEASTTAYTQLPLARSIAGRAVESGKIQVIADTRDEPDAVFPRLEGKELLSLVAVPLIVENQTLGVLSAYSETPNAFDDEAVELLQAFGAQASTALQNASLYAEAQRGREAAEREQQRLRELEQMKDEFLSTAAHELRTPLTAIRMSAGLLHEQMEFIASSSDEESAIDPRLLELTGLLQEGSQRMQALVNDLLDLTRLEQGRTGLNMETLDLREAVNASVATTMPLLESRKQVLTVQMPEVSYKVRGDRERLEQVFINLLSNANKYSPTNSRVQVRVYRAGQECIVTVRDNGPGVPEEEREKIFERFYRSSLHRNDRTSSTGLGLPIVRKIAEMHKGRVWVEPAPGGGSIFTLALPLVQTGA